MENDHAGLRLRDAVIRCRDAAGADYYDKAWVLVPRCFWEDVLDAADRPPTVFQSQFTLESVLLCFRNLGFNTNCGACMEIAFTGSTMHAHDCGVKKLAIEIS